jgi:hypothetical protein
LALCILQAGECSKNEENIQFAHVCFCLKRGERRQGTENNLKLKHNGL